MFNIINFLIFVKYIPPWNNAKILREFYVIKILEVNIKKNPAQQNRTGFSKYDLKPKSAFNRRCFPSRELSKLPACGHDDVSGTFFPFPLPKELCSTLLWPLP